MVKKKLPIKKSKDYVYFSSVANDLFLDGAQGEPSVSFGNLGHEEQTAWNIFARQHNSEGAKLYNSDCSKIKLTRLQTFILFKLLEKYNKEIENNYDMKSENWMKSGAGDSDYGLVHVTAAGLAKEIYNKVSGKRVNEIREAIRVLNEKKVIIRHFIRKNSANIIPRIEYSSLLTSVGVDVTDLRIKEFNFVRLHPVFFSLLQTRFIRNKYFTENLSKHLNYTLPSMTSMLLLKLLSKYGNIENGKVEFYESNLMNRICYKDYKNRRKEACRKMIKIACEDCMHIGLIKEYKDNIIGQTGEKKYFFQLDPEFFRSIPKEKKEEAAS